MQKHSAFKLLAGTAYVHGYANAWFTLSVCGNLLVAHWRTRCPYGEWHSTVAFWVCGVWTVQAVAQAVGRLRETEDYKIAVFTRSGTARIN